MKKLILVFVMWPMMVSVFGQNQRKSITDTVFQLDQAIVKETWDSMTIFLSTIL